MAGRFIRQNAENQVLGFNHMEVGEYLTKSWGLPETFYVPIGYHHCPQKILASNQIAKFAPNCSTFLLYTSICLMRLI